MDKCLHLVDGDVWPMMMRMPQLIGHPIFTVIRGCLFGASTSSSFNSSIAHTMTDDGWFSYFMVNLLQWPNRDICSSPTPPPLLWSVLLRENQLNPHWTSSGSSSSASSSSWTLNRFVNRWDDFENVGYMCYCLPPSSLPYYSLGEVIHYGRWRLLKE